MAFHSISERVSGREGERGEAERNFPSSSGSSLSRGMGTGAEQSLIGFGIDKSGGRVEFDND